MQKTTFIYALCEPGTRTVRYIGKAVNLKERFQRHLSQSVKYDSHLGRWLRLLAEREEQPELVVLREVEGNGSEAEKRYIRLARGCQMRLVNSTDGGDGGNTHPPGWVPSSETRALWSLQRTGKKATPEARANMSRAGKGRPKPRGENSPNFGRKHTKEELAKMSVANAGEKNGMFGKHPIHTELSNAKRSLAMSGEKNPQFGRPWSPEHREAVRVAKLRGKERDQEIEWALAPYTLE